MKQLNFFTIIYFALAFSGVSAAGLECGIHSITGPAVDDLSGATCLGADYRFSVIQGVHESEAIIRVVEPQFDSASRTNRFLVRGELAKTRDSALKEFCGRGLVSARVIDQGRSVLLVYSAATVVRWTVEKNEVGELVTRFNPRAAYACGGSEVGPLAMRDRLIFDEENRFLIINEYGELVRVNF